MNIHKRGLTFAIIGLLISIQLPTLAQEATATPAPWPPDLKIIFSNQVKVISTNYPTQTVLPEDDKCGSPVEIHAGEGSWHFYTDPHTKKLRFCQSKTGKLTDPLPSNISSYQDYAPSSSPDGQWLAFWNPETASDGTVDNYVLYSYQIETGKINHLGEIKHDSFREAVLVAQWVDNRHGAAYQGGGPEIYGTSIYSFDVEKENSLQLAISSWPEFKDNPTRYEYFETKQYLEWKTGSNGISNDVPCTLTVYDKNGVNQFHLADECLPLFKTDFEEDNQYIMRVGDIYFFKPVNKNEPNSISEIDAINVLTGQSSQIFVGIADLVSISPDGEHLILILNHSYLAIYELASNKIIYTSENIENEFVPHFPYTFNWLSDSQVLIYTSEKLATIPMGSGNDTINYGFPSSYRLVQIGDHQRVSIQAVYGDTLPEPQNVSPDGKWDLVGGQVYNFASAIHIPIFTDQANMYNTELNWINNEEIQATIRLNNDYTKEPIIYTIAFDKQ